MNTARAASQTSSGTQQFVSLIADPFQSQIQSNSIYAALVWSFGVSGLLFIGFCLLRPRTSTVYAPRAKHADEKHAPPPLDKRLFSWFSPIRNVKENELIEKIGVDAVVFLRFLRMTRNIFLVLTVVGCTILLPVELFGGHDVNNYDQISNLLKLTPQFNLGPKFWAFVVCAYLFDVIVCGFVWWNYKAVLRIRRAYFESSDYRSSLHSRTLLLTHIPPASRTDEGIARLVEEAKKTSDLPMTAIARNVKDLPKLIEEHEHAVHELEKYLASHLSNPNKLPDKRPVCKPSKGDQAHTADKRVDAIDYFTTRIRELESEIRQVRESVDKRNAMPYGFASYTHIEDAHSVAYAAQNKKFKGTIIRLAPKPNDLLWDNLPMSVAARRSRIFWDSLWIAALTVAFIVPNSLTAIFLSDLWNLGLVWPAFQATLNQHPTSWGVAQGIIAPAVQTLFYLVLPTVFRRLLTHSGDISKTSRERHVTSRLYAFFVFNNLIVFSIFAAAWQYASAVVAAKQKHENTWEAIIDGDLLTKLMLGFSKVSPYWITWQMQRNLSAATDLIQLWALVWRTFLRKFTSPTPRQLIELSAPQPFEYAEYYNNYLFVATVGLCFGTIQPLILPITAFYIGMDAWFKKYLLQYICITKTESGGVFWHPTINRILFATLLSNIVIALVVGAQGFDSTMLYCMIPLPILLAGFKWYCSYTFDNKIAYYTTTAFSDPEEAPHETKKPRRNDRVGVRFGNPALYSKLITPMVSAKSQHLLKEVYRGRLDHEMDAAGPAAGVYAYSDVYMSHMSPEQPGKGAAAAIAPFEIVAEGEMDFENFKRRAEFSNEHGGDGELYGVPEDFVRRPGSPSTLASRAETYGEARNRSESPGALGTTYQRGYHATPSAALRGESPRPPSTRQASLDVTAEGHPWKEDDEESLAGRGRLLGGAAGMGRSVTSGGNAATPGEYESEPGSGRATPRLGDEETSYDYFRKGRTG